LQRLDDRSGGAERRKQRIIATPPSLDQGSVAKSLSGKPMRHPASLLRPALFHVPAPARNLANADRMSFRRGGQ
jgi:hypothetical protein